VTARSALFPSDLPLDRSSLPPGLELAGRVVESTGSAVRLADAFANVWIEGDALGELYVGDLAVILCRASGGRFEAVRVELRQPAPTPRGDGEVGRMLFEGKGQRLRARSLALAVTRRYFEAEGFVEVETPLRVPAPGVDFHVDALPAGDDWLVTSPELEMKRLVVGGIPRQFQLARVSRRDERGALHEPEFTLLEWYRAFATQEAVLRDTELVVSRVAEALQGAPALVAPGGRRIHAAPPFLRLSVADAFRTYAGVTDVADLAGTDEGLYFQLLVDRVEPRLASIDRPLFLVEYPISQAALARACPTDPRFAERFELYVGGVELANGYGELTDPVEQRSRFEKERDRRAALSRTVYALNERFLTALEEGMPPTAGNALGFDRLLLLALGAERIQDVIAFPREHL
jgi:lysyl-tRNA synthetase class 2